MDLEFYRGKKVFITGHTGFKGSWMCEVLLLLGADVTGYSLKPPTNPALFDVLSLEKRMRSYIGDIRDLNYLMECMQEAQPEIVIHMAAQPIVRESYKDPVYTYDVNVMGTVNILECVRRTESVRSFINVTTDKVYKNNEWEWGYRENEELNGFDPYSNSKSCSELVTDSFKNSFFSNRDIAISTMRAGNVIGGGDFAVDRIIPDCVRAAIRGEDIIIRNPHSIRPYQHVLEPVIAYLLVAKEQYADKKIGGNYNVGPEEKECWTTGNLVTAFCKEWNKVMITDLSWKAIDDHGPHEANFLRLDCSKLKYRLDWKPQWNLETALEKIIQWHSAYLQKENMQDFTQMQIKEFLQA